MQCDLRDAKYRAQNLGVTEAPLEQFSKEGGKMISGGGGTGQNPQKCHFTSKKRENLELGVKRPPSPLAYGPESHG